jgi:hypothetical protein
MGSAAHLAKRLKGTGCGLNAAEECSNISEVCAHAWNAGARFRELTTRFGTGSRRLRTEQFATLTRQSSMRSHRAISALLLCALFAAASVPARASSTDRDTKKEYPLLDHRLAPNERMSLAFRGESESGSFHVWLMEEPAHRRIIALPGIVETYHDSTPQAVWSKDSRYVAVIFRSSRNQEEFRLYEIEGHRVRSIGGPRLFKQVTSREVADSDGAYLRYYGIEWRGPSRFVLREYQSFDPSPDADLLRLLAAYGHASKAGSFVEFAVEADCRLEADHRYRIVDLGPEIPALLSIGSESEIVNLGAENLGAGEALRSRFSDLFSVVKSAPWRARPILLLDVLLDVSLDTLTRATAAFDL